MSHKVKTLLLIMCICVLAFGFITGKSAYAWEKVEGTSIRIYKEGFSYQKITKAVKKRINGKSYRNNPYVSYSELRYVKVLHYNYKGKVVEGELIVNKAIAKDIVKIFYKLYRKKYPIQRMRLVDEYGADDDRSMAANNTSAFNYRSLSGSKTISMHAYGLAIDVNPRINPCVGGIRGLVPGNGKVYRQRNIKKCKGKYAYNMIQKNDYVYRLFKKYGFSWGGDWKSMKDYQHFYKEIKGYSDKVAL